VPVLTVIAGPNGSGKSSFARAAELGELLNPDEIAVQLNPADPRLAAIQAGREVLKRIAANIKDGKSFSLETTLAGEGPLKTIHTAKAHGFAVKLIYIALDSPDRNIRRVRERVARGGHNVPDGDVRRRYERSLVNAGEAIHLADEAKVYDNSGPEAVKVIEARNGVITWHAANPPAWVARLIEAVSGRATET
jgi:predicted ABC-type ATPase